MKMVISGADYGMTDSITDGCLKALRFGTLSDVGMMVNNECSQRAIMEIKKFAHVSITLDINLVSGRPLSDPREVATLVDSQGRLISSSQRKARGQHEQIAYPEAYQETKAQIDCFIKAFGRKPVTLNPHSYMTPNCYRAMKELGEEYGIKLLMDLFTDSRIKIPRGWYPNPLLGERGTFTLQQQAETDVIQAIISDPEQLTDYDYVLMLTHCGYCDGELLDLSTYSLIRGRELQALCSWEVKNWLERNNVELVTLEEMLAELG